jgi:hypothetical protein
MRGCLLVLLAACSASVDGNHTGDVDAPMADAQSSDAPPPVDARACAGGDARMAVADGSCVVRFDAAKTYADASAACVAFGAKLAILNSSERDAVARTLAGAADIFIGLTDQAVEATFVWSDGSALGYQNFYPGEPNDGAGNFPEDCIIVNGVRGGQWDDRRCVPDPNTGAGGMYPYFCLF